MRFHPVQLLNHFIDSIFVVFSNSEFQQFRVIANAGFQLVNGTDYLIQLGTFLAQLLRVVRVFPDSRIFQLTVYFFQPILLFGIVKDTPSGRWHVRPGP